MQPRVQRMSPLQDRQELVVVDLGTLLVALWRRLNLETVNANTYHIRRNFVALSTLCIWHLQIDQLDLSQKAEKRCRTVPLQSRVVCSFSQPHMVTEAPSLMVLVLTTRTVRRTSLANKVWQTWRLPVGSHQYLNVCTSYSVYDHTIGNTPVLVRSPKLSLIGRG